MLIGLAFVVWNPFGYIVGLNIQGSLGRLHSLTFLCMSYLFLCFWVKMKDMPLLTRFFLTLIFCWIGYYNYDVLWDISYNTFSIFGALPFYVFMRLMVSHIIPLSIIFTLRKHKKAWRIPSIQIKRFLMVLAVNFVMILWLESTGFFPEFWQYRYGVGADPHGWVWFIGKTIGLLSWLFAFDFHLPTERIKDLMKRFRVT